MPLRLQISEWLCVEEGGPFLVAFPFFLDWGATALPRVVEMPVVEDPTAPWFCFDPGSGRSKTSHLGWMSPLKWSLGLHFISEGKSFACCHFIWYIYIYIHTCVCVCVCMCVFKTSTILLVFQLLSSPAFQKLSCSAKLRHGPCA